LVEGYASAAKGLFLIDDLDTVAIRNDLNQVITILDGYTAKNMEWACRQGLKFDTAKTQAAQFTCG